ncbi:MAG: universal stress protein [Bacteroidetes bacterium]|nr:universal stress protein [Bacteroidota bacterium]
MMNTLLIPTDFSPIADNAITYAIELASYYKLDIDLFHVAVVATTGADMMYIDVSNDFIQSAEAEMAKKISELNSKYPSIQFNGKVTTGQFIGSLQQYCNDTHPIAVVMGITGEGTAIDKLIGSNVILAMKNIHEPLLVVPRKAIFKPITNLCFACDMKKVVNSTPILSIKAFAKLFNAKIHMLNIDFENRHYSANTPTELETLNEMFEGLETQYHFIEHENVQEAIDEFIEANSMDLLIMLPKKHSMFEGLFRKSHTKEMLYHSHVPILALHQQ